jgi:hypothetical protein
MAKYCYELLRDRNGVVVAREEVPLDTIVEADAESKARGFTHLQVFDIGEGEVWNREAGEWRLPGRSVIAEFAPGDLEFVDE